VRISSPSFDLLESILKPGGQRLLIVSPFMSAVGLNRIGSVLDRHSWDGFEELEIWVFLSVDAHRTHDFQLGKLMRYRCATPAQVETERSGLNCLERYRKRDILAS
jgi:hypothetical protein